jgi:sigma-B regulation protein RsbU (phosphoserine phosphatase)
MKILVVEDDALTREALTGAVRKFGHEPIVAEDGDRAWHLYQEDSDIRVVVTDWIMPKCDGLELCRRIRGNRERAYTYILLLTIKSGKESFLEGMQAGADDFTTKPFDWDELEARVSVAERILGLHTELSRLEQLLPICCYCKNIQDGRTEWIPVETFVTRQTSSELTHTICPDCYETEVKPQLEEWKNE